MLKGAAPVTVRNIPALIPATIMFAVSSRVIQNNIMISSCYNDVLKQNTNLGHMCRTFLAQIRGGGGGGIHPLSPSHEGDISNPTASYLSSPYEHHATSHSNERRRFFFIIV
ncbi:hypothetical protein Pmar_PMAR029281 [Perkinsus marinus ATCC 50983]|uniref:Uncharacterized protein n=1 Tax=Perkinsus marinus (strain ATCC 50983 / TXsc) TaxID=423536 RepID=C5KMQ7_PERM5|nr:hypothetical protein Pmar_PMAR029281 [Perkinsus marinus ATCC 50983]EER14215.1 hypothetical protein Pmar_PMAR029281 [Perkinsus marinus ATCC 50983]|eukprot:XP_002782420.1 hypothetical protein Pmar_PMAR029281 [Perkinsus marinus ATCC 50983]